MSILRGLYLRDVPFVAVDVGTKYIKLLQLETNASKPSITHLHRILTPRGMFENGLNIELLTRSLKDVVKKYGFAGKRVISSAGGNVVITRHIKAPYGPGDELNRSLRYRAEKAIPVSVDNMIIKWVPLGVTQISENPDQKEIHILVAAVDKGFMYKFYNAFERAGMNLEIVDLQVLALWRLFNGLNQNGLFCEMYPWECFAVADIGASSTQVVFINKGEFCYSRSFPNGSAGESEPEIVTELERSLNYYQNQEGKVVEKLVLTGGGSKTLGELISAQSETLNLLVETGRLQEGARLIDPSFAVVLGLGLRKVFKDV